MIQAQELRIGNYLQNWGHYCVVESINKDGVMVTFLHHVDGMFHDMPYTPKGIPLTEEILLKAGFELKVEGNAVYSLLKKIYGMFKTEHNKDGSIYDTYFEIYVEGCPLVKIRALHHLQNYVHTIANSELKITL